MSRIHLLYDGVQYTVCVDDVERLKAQIADAVSSLQPTWLRVCIGEGRPQAADILLHNSANVSLIEVEASNADQSGVFFP